VSIVCSDDNNNNDNNRQNGIVIRNTVATGVWRQLNGAASDENISAYI